MRHTEAVNRAQLKIVARALLAVFFLLLILVVLLPSQDHAALGVVERFARWAAEFGVPYRIAFPVLEFAANILLFVPLGVLMPLAIGSVRPAVLVGTALLGLGVSLVIEFAQWWIPGRVSDPRDLFANTLGTVIGVLAVALGSSAMRWIRTA